MKKLRRLPKYRSRRSHRRFPCSEENAEYLLVVPAFTSELAWLFAIVTHSLAILRADGGSGLMAILSLLLLSLMMAILSHMLLLGLFLLTSSWCPFHLGWERLPSDMPFLKMWVIDLVKAQVAAIVLWISRGCFIFQIR